MLEPLPPFADPIAIRRDAARILASRERMTVIPLRARLSPPRRERTVIESSYM